MLFENELVDAEMRDAWRVEGRVHQFDDEITVLVDVAGKSTGDEPLRSVIVRQRLRESSTS